MHTVGFLSYKNIFENLINLSIYVCLKYRGFLSPSMHYGTTLGTEWCPCFEVSLNFKVCDREAYLRTYLCIYVLLWTANYEISCAFMMYTVCTFCTYTYVYYVHSSFVMSFQRTVPVLSYSFISQSSNAELFLGQVCTYVRVHSMIVIITVIIAQPTISNKVCMYYSIHCLSSFTLYMYVLYVQ